MSASCGRERGQPNAAAYWTGEADLDVQRDQSSAAAVFTHAQCHLFVGVSA